MFGKRDNKVKGSSGEQRAVEYLKREGYEILERNFITDVGEIDIIAVGEGYLVFVEVKARYNTDFGFAAEAVSCRKQQKISQVAAQYIKKYGRFSVPVRFDVVEVYFEQNSINHIKGAFDSFLRY